MSKPSQPLLSEEFRHRVHACLFPDVYISDMSRLSSCPPQHAHFSCVQFPLLLLSNCSTLCTIHYGRFYSRLVHFVFQLCWYVPVAHHPSQCDNTRKNRFIKMLKHAFICVVILTTSSILLISIQSWIYELEDISLWPNKYGLCYICTLYRCITLFKTSE